MESLYTEELPGGASWSAVLRRGQGLRLVDETGRANVTATFLRADFPSERYNMPDTLKSQFIARLTAPYVLYSDMGHVLASMVEDTVGWHDAFSGPSDAASVEARFGKGTYQALRNGRHTNARDHLLVEIAKYGLGERDLPSVVNFFSRVSVAQDGALSWTPQGNPGQFLTLRFEMDVLVALSATAHPLDPATAWDPAGVRLEVLRLPPPAFEDASRQCCPYNVRGFTLTERLFL
jgi:uncharacterized protein